MDKILHGNSLELLKTLEDNSVDSIVTDPPYELGFMGKEWDSTGIAYNVELWKECYRVLKHGGYLLAFSGSRTYHRMACSIEDAGFNIKDMIEWCYGSGFPKGQDISKGIDKLDAKYKKEEMNYKFTAWMRTTGLTPSKIDKITGTCMGSHYLTSIEQPSIPTRELFEKLRPFINIEVPDYIEDIINTRTLKSENLQNREVVKQVTNGSNSNIKIKGTKKEYNITTSYTSEAKQWEGWNTQLKPSHEPICVAQKPISEKNIALNILKWGVGALNIGGCRVGNQHFSQKDEYIKSKGIYGDKVLKVKEYNGRYPANSIFDTESGQALDEQAGLEVSNYFYNVEEDITPFYYCPKASSKERGEFNLHPTVKPIKLIKYLIKLVTPPNGVCLDIFEGSGTHAVSCIELTKEDYPVQYIGMEMTNEYIDIINKRIEQHSKE